MSWRDWLAIVVVTILTVKPRWALFHFVPRKPTEDTEETDAHT